MNYSNATMTAHAPAACKLGGPGPVRSNPNENRRKENRFSVDDIVYVVVDTKPQQMMGQMVEISSQGLAFTFVDLEGVSRKLMECDNLQLDLFAGGRGYFIRNLPCRIISKIDDTSVSALSSVQIKRVGVEFIALSVSQQVQINALVRRQHRPA